MSNSGAETTSRTEHELRNYGFTSGEPIHEWPVSFTKEELQSSLFSSTYSEPVSLRLISIDEEVQLRVVVTSARAHYSEYSVGAGSLPVGCYNEPCWTVEAWVMPSGFGPEQDARFVRVLVNDRFDSMVWQVVSTAIHPDGPIRLVSD